MNLPNEISSAIDADDAQRLREILEPNLNLEDETGNAPLHLAAMSGRMQCLNVILGASGCNVNQGNRQGRTALHLSAFRGKTNVVDRLLQIKGIDVNKKTQGNGCTATYFASCKGNSDIVAKLLAAGGDPNEGTSSHSTPLIAAASVGSRSTLTILLDAGANVNVQNDSGITAMHAAASQGFCSIVEYLKMNGGNSEICDGLGRTPNDIFASKQKTYLPSSVTVDSHLCHNHIQDIKTQHLYDYYNKSNLHSNTNNNNNDNNIDNNVIWDAVKFPEGTNKTAVANSTHFIKDDLTTVKPSVNQQDNSLFKRTTATETEGKEILGTHTNRPQTQFVLYDDEHCNSTEEFFLSNNSLSRQSDCTTLNETYPNRKKNGLLTGSNRFNRSLNKVHNPLSADQNIDCSTHSGSRSAGTLSDKSQQTPPERHSHHTTTTTATTTIIMEREAASLIDDLGPLNNKPTYSSVIS